MLSTSLTIDSSQLCSMQYMHQHKPHELYLNSNSYLADGGITCTSLDLQKNESVKSSQNNSSWYISLPEFEYLDTQVPENSTEISERREKVLDYSKDSLKFARRLSRQFIVLIQDRMSAFSQSFTSYSFEIIQMQATACDVHITSKDKLTHLVYTIIRDSWRGFSRQLGSSQNRKISKVTKSLWDTVFTYEGFWKTNEPIDDYKCSALELMKDLDSYITFYSEGSLEAFKGFFKHIVFLTNHAMVLTFLFSDKTYSSEFRENVNMFDNYMILSLFPDLFSIYNHRRGVFAKDCCGMCKVCRVNKNDWHLTSKTLTCHEDTVKLKNLLSEDYLYPTDNRQTAINVINFLVTLDH